MTADDRERESLALGLGSGAASSVLVTVVNPEQTLLDEIGDRQMKRADIAASYALALRSPESINWAKVNRRIVERWTPAALRWIKERAWKLFGEATEANR